MHSTPASALGWLPCVENQRCTRASAYLHGLQDRVSGRVDIVQGCNFHCTGQQHTPKVSSEAHNSTKDLRTDEHYLRSVKVFFSQTAKKTRFLSNFLDHFQWRHQYIMVVKLNRNYQYNYQFFFHLRHFIDECYVMSSKRSRALKVCDPFIMGLPSHLS